MNIRKIYSILFLVFICYYSGAAQTVPTSYEMAKRIGEAKYKTLVKDNAPAEMRYVVLKKECKFEKLLKYENAVYVVENTYDLKGKTVVIPKNAVLVFRKGNVKNGVLKGNATKYTLIGETEVACQLAGTWERIAPIYAASELGFRSGQQSAWEYNYKKLQEVIGRGINIYLDGTYYVSFLKPIMLNYELHIFGGELFFSKHGFDLTNKGGIYANGVHFSSMPGSKTDDIVCGTREKHPAITTSYISFLNCHFSCDRVLSFEFQYGNPDKQLFGIKSISVERCFADHTAKFLVLDAPLLEQCSFKNNTFTNFSHTPIYFTPNHSVRTHPDEQNTNPWTEEIVRASCPVIIDSNIFVGKEVSVNSYYCAALIVGNRCVFHNNYLRDIINYSDKNSKGHTAYDAYLSCVDVDYENNYIENLISYAKDGSSKPLNGIGKSKTNPLEPFEVKATRRYVNNIFICDGNKYLAKGAEPSSMNISIFSNVSPIETYIWENNSVIYKNIVLEGRTWASKYGSFQMCNNYFECSDLTGYLVFPNSANDCSGFIIQNNIFRTENSSQVVIFNQLYQKSYNNYQHGVISISDNVFHNALPVYHLFAADTIGIKRNKVENASLAKNIYLSNYSGDNTPLAIQDMDVEIVLDTKGQAKGAVHQFFSSSSGGSFALVMKSVPEKGVYYNYLIDKDHRFQIILSDGVRITEVSFELIDNVVVYEFNGEKRQINFDSTKSISWYSKDGITLKTSFVKGQPNRIVTTLFGKGSKDIKLTYNGE